MSKTGDWFDTIRKMNCGNSVMPLVNSVCEVCNKCEERMLKVGSIAICMDCMPKTFKTNDPLSESVYKELIKKQYNRITKEE